jgi:protocatechuate 3,4-dioxygenase beta subunit
MSMTCFKNSRRGFVGALAFGATAFAARGAFAEELTRTPNTNEGPFFPKKGIVSLDISWS